MRGHSRILGTYMRTKSMFYWPKKKGDIKAFFKSCDVFILAKGEHRPYPGFFQPLAISQ